VIFIIIDESAGGVSIKARFQWITCLSAVIIE
jgi:hypothetical protein